MRGTTKPVALIVTLSLTLALALVAAQGSFGADTTSELTTMLSTATETTPAASTSADTTTAPATTASTTTTEPLPRATSSVVPSGTSVAPPTKDPVAEIWLKGSRTSEKSTSTDGSATTDETSTETKAKNSTPVMGFAEGREGVVTVGADFKHTKMKEGLFRITVTLPTGLTYVRSASDAQGVRTASPNLACTAAGQVVTCNLVSTDPKIAARLKDSQSIYLYIVVRTANGLVPVPDPKQPTKPVSLGEITAKLDVSTAAGDLTGNASIAAEAATGYLTPRLTAQVLATDNTGYKRAFQIRIRNNGGLPAQAGNGVPAVRITEFLPSDDPAIPFTVTGVGWKCTPGATTKPTICTTNQTVAVGGRPNDLTVTWSPLTGRTTKERQTYYDWTLSMQARWTGTSKVNGVDRKVSGRCETKQPFRWRLKHLIPPRMDAQIAASDGINLLQGSTRNIHIKVGNIGQDPAINPGVKIRVPEGVTIKSLQSDWSCDPSTTGATCRSKRTTIEPGKRQILRIQAAATTTAPPGHGKITAQPFADLHFDPVSRAIPFVVLDIGDALITPFVQFAEAGKPWKTWTHGGHTAVEVDQGFTYRIALVNRGNVALEAGSTVTVKQAIGSGIKLLSATLSNGGTCSGTTSVSCSFTTDTAVAPGATSTTLDVAIVASAVTKHAKLGHVEVRIANTPAQRSIPVLLNVVPNDHTITISTHIKQTPDVGGIGTITMRAKNTQRSTSIKDLVVRTKLPTGLRFVDSDGAGWTCRSESANVTCSYPKSLAGRASTPRATLNVVASGSPQKAMTTWSATARTVAANDAELGLTKLKIPVLAKIAIRATAKPTLIAASADLRKTHTVSLVGNQSVGNGMSLDYTWTQRCASASDVAAYGKCPSKKPTPVARVKTPDQANAEAVIPGVTERTRFIFELTITNGSTTLTKAVTVTAAAKAKLVQKTEKLSTSLDSTTIAAGKSQQAAQAAAERQRNAAAKAAAAKARNQQKQNAAKAKAQTKGQLKVSAGTGLITANADTEVQLRATVTGGDGTHTIKWQQTSGSSVTLQNDTAATTSLRAPSTPGYLAFSVTATDKDGHIARSAVTVQVEPKGTTAPAGLTVTIAGAPELIAPSGKSIPLVAHTTGGVGNVTYTWTQTQGAATPLAGAKSAAASVTVPSGEQTLQVQVTARDAKGAVATATVSVAPPGAPPVISITGGETTTAPLGEKVTIKTTVTGGTGDFKYLWKQVGGTKTKLEATNKAELTTTLPRKQTVNAYQLTVTDKTGQVSTAVATISVGAPANGAAYCSILKKSAGSAPAVVSLGTGSSVTFKELSSSSTSCGSTATSRQSSSASFSNTSFTFGGVTISNASGSVSPAFISITSGTVTTPSSWGLPATSIGTEPLTVAFTGAKGSTGELSGSLNVAGFPFLTLPSGWSGTSSLSIAPNTANTATVITIGATATNGTGTVTVNGSSTTAGVFTASVSANDLLNIGNATVDLNGSVSNATGTVTSTITGSLASPATLVSGVQISALTATWQTGSTGPIAKGTSTIALSAGSDTSALTAAFSYTNAANWSATLNGSGKGVWTPVSGLNLSPADFAGSIQQTDGVWDWNITATDTDWQASSVLDFTQTTLDLSNTCTSTTLKCPATSMFLQVRTTATLGTSSSNQMTASVQAVFGLGAEPGFSAAGTIGGTFTAAPDLVLTLTGATFTVDDPTGKDLTPSLTIPTATLQTPDAWRLPVISVGTTPIALTFTGTNNATPQIVGSLTAPGFPFLTLPSGWSGTTSLAFADGPGNSYATFNATANDGSTGTVDLSATINGNTTFSASVTANDLVTVEGTSLDLAGTATNTSGTTVASISGSINSPITLAPGVQLTTLTADWTDATDGPVIDGVATVAVSSGSETPTALTANLSYTSPTTWSVTLTAAGGPTWTPLPGLAITPSDFSGAISKTNGTFDWSIKATVPQWVVTGALTLTTTTLQLSNSCVDPTLVCPTADMFMILKTTAQVSPPGVDPFTADAAAVLGIGGGGGFSLAADVDGSIGIVPDVLTITSPAIFVGYNLPVGSVTPSTGGPTFTNETEGGWELALSGGLDVPGLGNFSDITANITSGGISLGGTDANGVSLGSGNGSQSSSVFGFSTVKATMTADIVSYGTQAITLLPNWIYVAGGYTTPAWFTNLTGETPPPAMATIQFQPSTGFFNSIVDFEGQYNLPAGGGGTSLTVTTLNFAINFNAEGLSIGAGGEVQMGAASVGGGSSTAPTLSLEITWDTETNQIFASFGFLDEAGWQNAFGVNGLTVTEAIISLGVDLDTAIPTPTLALMASGDLPTSLTQYFGVSNQIPITVAAELSLENPCVEIEVGSSKGTTPILDVGNGAVTATYFMFVVAPTGCTIGNVGGQPFVITPGMGLQFDGDVFGTEVDVQATLSLDPTIFVASMTIGAFTIPDGAGGIGISQTVLDVNLNEQTQTNTVKFSGGITMFGTTIDVAGFMTVDEATATTNAGLTVSQSQALTVSGFSLSNLSITANVSIGPKVADVSIAASGNLNIMGTDVNIIAFDATINNGVVENVTVDVQASINLGPANANGTFDMSFTESTGEFDLNADVTMTISGFSMAATLDISPKCVAFTGALSYGSVFNANLAGTMIYQAGCAELVTNSSLTPVQGNPGDFSFSATNVAIGFGAFSAGGDVYMGSVGGDFYTNLTATVGLSPQDTNNSITVNGQFNSNGNFSISGVGNLDLAGFNLSVTATVSNTNGNVDISASASLNLAGTNVNLAGQFEMNNGAPSTTLTATVSPLTIAGFDLGNVNVVLTQTPTSAGINAAININAGVATLSGQLTFIENGGTPLFYLAANGNLDLGIVNAELSGIFTDCTDSTCAQQATPTLTMNGDIAIYSVTYNFPTIVISGNGDFSITSSSSGSSCSDATEVLGVYWQACFSYTQYLLISDESPYFSVSASMSADVQDQTWNLFDNPYDCACVSWPWWLGGGTTCLTCYSGGWSSWRTFLDFSGDFSFTADPFSLSIYVDGIGFTI